MTKYPNTDEGPPTTGWVQRVFCLGPKVTKPIQDKANIAPRATMVVPSPPKPTVRTSHAGGGGKAGACPTKTSARNTRDNANATVTASSVHAYGVVGGVYDPTGGSVYPTPTDIGGNGVGGLPPLAHPSSHLGHTGWDTSYASYDAGGGGGGGGIGGYDGGGGAAGGYGGGGGGGFGGGGRDGGGGC